MSHVAKLASDAVTAGNGILRLAPTWVPRSFLQPGRPLCYSSLRIPANAPGSWETALSLRKALSAATSQRNTLYRLG